MMNKEVAKKWVDALRSGEYTQTQQTLRDKNGYCCIGVLCDLYRREVGNADWLNEKSDLEIFVVGTGEPLRDEDDRVLSDDETMEDSEAPRAVKKWAGLPDDLQVTYIKLNDTGAPFTSIAAEIERDAGLVE